VSTPATCRPDEASERETPSDGVASQHPDAPQLSGRFWTGMLVLAVLLVVADLASKSAAQAYLDAPLPRNVVAIPGVLDFTYRENTGGPFSILAGSDWSWLLGPLALLATAGVVVWVVRAQVRSRVEALACTIIVGGAVGNLIDRLSLGAVRDFLSLTCIRWPVFNLADSFICVGVALLLWELLVGDRRHASSKRPMPRKPSSSSA